MKIFEIAGVQFDPKLIEFWKQATPEQMKYYFIQDNCYGASQDFESFLHEKYGIGNAEIVPIGRKTGNQLRFGWFKTDLPDLHEDALESKDRTAMREQGLNPRSKVDRAKYIEANNLTEEFCLIPHSWVEIRGQILDPSGFYIDGKSGQFDRLVLDKQNLAARYQYY